MEFGLFQKQTTNLVMTQELRQAIHILQYTSLELAHFINEQELDNPLLDVKPVNDRNESSSVSTMIWCLRGTDLPRLTMR